MDGPNPTADSHVSTLKSEEVFCVFVGHQVEQCVFILVSYRWLVDWGEKEKFVNIFHSHTSGRVSENRYIMIHTH
jgi:hypothetical protein